MTWTRGKLASYKNSKYDYDCIGRRISKTVSGAVVTYTYDIQGRLIKSSDGMEYFYGGSDVIAFKYNGLLYFYKRDIQGNINAILDSAGNTVVHYEYDAWGNHTGSGSNTALGNLNPFRYRGYFYDTDTGFYYLKTRYYDPEIGRFISPDSVYYADPETVDGLNLYAYCLNNPVNYVDPTGTFAFTTAMIIGAIIGAVIGATVGGVVAYNTAKENGATGGQLFGWTMFGILCGGVIGGAIGAFIGWAAPSVGAFFGTSFKLGSLMLASGKTITISITGGQAVAGTLGVLVWFASNEKPGNNRKQNAQIRDAVRELGENPNDPHIKDTINEVEQYIRKNKLSLGYKGLLELLMDFLP